ncbi:MAG: hypothetical protein H0X73_13370 [Chthoniobacterales bacterium]|nr:hypothetical protein [Chthoniobacterales bacterium]
MRKLACTLILGITTLHVAAGADSAVVAAPPQDKLNGSLINESGAFELKTTSSFAVDENSRNPFWPIGWRPAVRRASTDDQTGPDIPPTSFLVSSIMTGQGSRFAIINGKPVQEGQVFGLQMGTEVYQITVKAIEDGHVILQRRDQEFAVLLRRR